MKAKIGQLEKSRNSFPSDNQFSEDQTAESKLKLFVKII